ncbi:MAG: hypothetical protein IJK32_06765 [Bacteroidales bacterium]|nr:hypothetical protein [Bacteroidales bacterium]
MVGDIELRAFQQLIDSVLVTLNEKAAKEIKRFKGMSPSDLEVEVFQTIKDACGEESFFQKDEVRLVSGMRFPDILVGRNFGVEVKSTNKDHWTSTGSSIVESTRDRDVECIYLLFGKLGGDIPEFRCRPYSDVLSEVAVTHSPRYRIDMTLGAGETIFDKMGISYEDLRSSKNQITAVQDYYRKMALVEGHQMPWWISDDKSADSSVGMNIRSWRILSANEKSNLVAQLLVLFPEVIFGDYENAAMWLVSTRGIVCTNLRDPFSAGGQIKQMNGAKLDTPMPHIVKTVADKYPLILALMKDKEFQDQISAFNPDLLPDIAYRWFDQVQASLSRVGVIIPVEDLLKGELK